MKSEKVVSHKEKRNGKDEKSRSKKDDKTIEQVLKSLGNFETPEEKLSALCKKYLEIIDENRKLQMTLKQTEKCIVMIQREKEQLQSEKSKSVLTRSRLENVCRELQRQNKAVKEESLLKLREEEEKRKEVSAKFQSTLTEITALMTETNEKNVKLHEDNIEIHKKFKSVFDEMDIREQHFDRMHQMMKHELQMAEAKLAKVYLEMSEEKETLLKEKNQLLLKLTEYEVKIQELQTVEANLRSQVNMYTDKYEEFQSALTKSNEVFGGFNEEMEKMSKKILKLEKETSIWKSRWEKGRAALLEMATEKQTRDAEIVKLNRKCLLLQELCKAFQQERTTLLAQLKEKSTDNNEEDKPEDKKLIESVKFAAEALIINGASIMNDINTKLKEQTKELKTEPSKEVSNSEPEKILNKIETAKTVNSEEEKRLEESIPVEKEETQSTVIELKLENTTECKEKILQVPVEIQNIPETETISINSSDVVEPIDSNEQLVSLTVSNAPDIIKCISESQVNDIKENYLQESVISGNENVPKVLNHTENSVKAVPNGEVHSHSITNKKHKDGKKKKTKN